jgi:hypothetical protein
MPSLTLRTHSALFGLFALSVSACELTYDTPETPAKTSIRAIHLSPGAPNVDVILDGDVEEALVRDLAFRRTSRYVELPAGEATLDVLPAGAAFEQRVLHVGPVVLEGEKQYTAVAFDAVATIRALLLEDDAGTTLGAGNIRVRFVHAAAGVGKVDVWSLPAQGSPALVYDNIELGGSGPYLDLPIGAHELGIDVNDDAQPEIIFPLPSLAAGTVANIFAVADTAGAVNLIAQVQSGATLEIEPKVEMQNPPPPPPPPPGDPTNLRVLHLSPDAPAVNVYANGDAAAAVSGLAFGSGTSYLSIPSGDYRFDISPATGTIQDSILRIDDISLAEDASYTAVAVGELRSLQVLALEDRLDAVPAGKIRVRAIHAAAGVGEVDIWNIPARGAPSRLYENGAVGVAGDYLELPAAAYSLGIDANDDARPDFVFDLPALAEGTVANVYAVRDSAGAVYLLAQFADSTLAKIDARDLTPARVRVIHLSPDAPAVSLYANEIPTAVVDDLLFRSGTGYLEVPNGTYTFDIAPARSSLDSSVLRVDNVTLERERSYTAAAIGALSSLGVLALEDDFSALPANTIRVRAIHAAVGVGRVNVLNVPSAGAPSTIFAALDFGAATDYLEVPAGAYRLGIDVDNDHHPDLLFSLPSLPAGTVANVFASAGMMGDVELVAQLNDGTVARIAAH